MSVETQSIGIEKKVKIGDDKVNFEEEIDSNSKQIIFDNSKETEKFICQSSEISKSSGENTASRSSASLSFSSVKSETSSFDSDISKSNYSSDAESDSDSDSDSDTDSCYKKRRSSSSSNSDSRSSSSESSSESDSEKEKKREKKLKKKEKKARENESMKELIEKFRSSEISEMGPHSNKQPMPHNNQVRHTSKKGKKQIIKNILAKRDACQSIQPIIYQSIPTPPITPPILTQDEGLNHLNEVIDLELYPGNLPNLDADKIEKLINNVPLPLEKDEKICCREVVKMDLNAIEKNRDCYKNSLFIQIAQLPKIGHQLHQKTIELLELDPNETEITFDTQMLAKHLIPRFEREERKTGRTILKHILNEPNMHNETPVTIVLKNDRLEMLKLIYPHSMMESRQEPLMHTMLHIVCLYGSYNCFQYLMENYYSQVVNDIYINAKDKNGDSALGLAIKNMSTDKINNYYNIILELTKWNCIDLKVKNVDDNGLAHLICQNKTCPQNIKIDLLKSIKATKADLIHQRNKDMKSAYDLWGQCFHLINASEMLEFVTYNGANNSQ